MAVINTNITSLIGQNNLNKSQSDLSTAMERLSSGLRINSAKDDAAGQAIANRMTSQVTGLTQASRNANDGISLAQTTEGALDQINDNLQRVRELTVQATNGTNSASDLSSIQDEINARLDEIDRVSAQTDFNGTKVLDGSKTDIKIQVGADDGQTISISLQKMDSDSLKLGSFDVSKMVDTKALSAEVSEVATATSNVTVNIAADSDTADAETADGLYALADGTGYVVKDENDDYYAAQVADDGSVSWDSSGATVDAADVDVAGGELAEVEVDVAGTATVTGIDAAAGESLHEVQDSEGNGTGEYVVKTVTTDAVTGKDVTTYNKAEIAADGAVTKGDSLTGDPLAALDSALSQVDDMRSDLGAVQNRFESAIDNLSTTSTNISAARSRIEDADYAVEVSNMTRAQILQQAGTSVLAQANQVPQGVLSLLQ